MRFELSDAKETVEQLVVVNTVDDLMAISEAHGGKALVVDFGNKIFDPSIMIYNDYLE